MRSAFPATIGVFLLTLPGLAQITPDNSLGAESSVVTPDVLREGSLIDEITGGAIRDNNLFHSFRDFNVNEGQRVYFANPATVDSIFSRVSGQNPSVIFGTLGVLGSANLFLINPNGFIYGPNSVLDIRGAFVASTTEAFSFDNGYSFSALAPEAPPLLTLSTPMGLAQWLPPTSGTIDSTGNLAVGGDLTLEGQVVTFTGSLEAGGDLRLRASDRLQITDSPEQPFIASAGDNLTIQGNHTLTIAALAHPQSGLYAGGDITVRSLNSVGGDAHYFAGGDFRVETLSGGLGAWNSPNDPIIRASGDVSFDEYSGASLHILAGGSVTVPGLILITGPDTTGNAISPITTPELANITLSNGASLVIDGVNQPTLDIRAGTTAFNPAGVVGDNSGILGDPVTFDPATGGPAAGTASSADIQIGAIVNPGGLIFVTNQYQPQPGLAGDIAISELITADFNGGGDVVVDSRGGLTFDFINVSGENADLEIGGDSGALTLLSEGALAMPFPTLVFAYGIDNNPILLQSNTAISQEGAELGTNPFDLSLINSFSLGENPDGAITLRAPAINLGGNIITTTAGNGPGSQIRVEADTFETLQSSLVTETIGPGPSGNIQITAGAIATELSQIVSVSFSDSDGKGGDVTLNVGSLSGRTGAQFGSFAFASGDAGNVVINADEIALSGFAPETFNNGIFTSSAIFSTAQAGAIGNSGTVNLSTRKLTLTEAGAVFTSSFAEGDAGTINVNASESIVIDGAVFVDFIDDIQPSAITSELFTGATGNGGVINITTPVLTVTNGGSISSLSDGNGSAGSVNINASESVTFDGVATFGTGQAGQRERVSRVEVVALEGATGNAGTLAIAAPSLTLSNGARLEATTAGPGDAGDIQLDLVDELILTGAGTGIFASTTADSTGDGGDITIDPARIIIADGAQVSVASLGSGIAGNLLMRGGTLILDQGIISAETSSSTGGDITLRISDVVILQNGSRISTTAGTAQAGGDGGNIDIETAYLIATPDENNDITANAFFGSGGRVLITAEGIFGLTPRSRAELEALLGTSDPAQLDPRNLPSSDITAISQANPELSGEVVLASPDTDPNQGAIALPDNIVDASRLIAQGCSSGSIAAQEIGSLVVTGRGGLPTDPTGTLNSHQLLLDWITPPAESVSTTPAATVAVPAAATTAPRLEEVQALRLNDAGEVILVAQGETPVDAAGRLSGLTCTGEVQGNET